MNYYKITNEEENHCGLQYHDGLVKDILPFNPYGSCQPGGIYFAREDILAFLNYGCWIRKVTLPEDARVYENPGVPKKWKADKVILGERERINANVIRRLIEEGADVHADKDYALCCAASNGYADVVRILLEDGTYTEYRAKWLSKAGYKDAAKVIREKNRGVK